MPEERDSSMQGEDSQQRQPGEQRRRKPVLSPELREVLHMLKSLETKPAAG